MDIYTIEMISSTKTDKKIEEGFLGQKMIVLPPNTRHSIRKNNLISQFYVTASGFYPRAAHHDRERDAGSNEYILLYCTAGSGTVNIAEKTSVLKPNHFIILPRNTPHHYRSSPDDPWTIYWLHFTGHHAEYLFRKYAEQKSEPVFFAYDERTIENFDRIFTLFENSFEERNLEIVNIKYLDFISSFLYADQTEPTTSGRDKITDSIAFMKAQLASQYTVQDFADQQNLSVTHYSRLFHAKTGNSPNQYFNQLKVQAACQYLYFTDKSIKEICKELSFDDPYYFSRLFKKLMGVSPIKYRSQHKKG